MKIGVSSYSFSQYIQKGMLTQLTAVKKAAEMGFDCIEFTDLTPPEGMSAADYAAEIKAEAEKNNIEISAYVVGANLAKKDEGELECEIKRLKECLDIAHILGAKYFRHDVMYDYKDFRSFDLALPTIARAARAVTEYGESLGIKTMTENHGYICQDSDRVEKLINAVNHPNYGLLADIGNFLCADEDPHRALSRVANLAFMAHAKDFEVHDFKYEGGFDTRGCKRLVGVSVGSGDVGAEQSVAILKRAGFDGCIDIEYEGSGDCIEGIRQSFEFLKKII